MLDWSVDLEGPGSGGSRLGIDEKSEIPDASVGFGWGLKLSSPLRKAVCINQYRHTSYWGLWGRTFTKLHAK